MMFILQIRKLKLRLINLQICTEIMVGLELEIGFVLLPERDRTGSALVQPGMCGFRHHAGKISQYGSGWFWEYVYEAVTLSG